MPVAQPIAGYSSKTAAVSGLTCRGLNDYEIARMLKITRKSVSALRASATRRKCGKMISLKLSDEEYLDLKQQAQAEGWSISAEIRARCFNTDYLDPEEEKS